MIATLANWVMLVKPASFAFNDQTALSNLFQNQLTSLTSDEVLRKVQEEFDGAVQQLHQHGVNVVVVPDSVRPPKPDAIFPNNWISTRPDGTIVLYPMQAVNRRAERRPEILDELRDLFDVAKVIDYSIHEERGVFLEGTGSIVFDHENKVAYACYSARTDRHFFERVASEMGYRPLGFHAVDAQGKAIYHTNVMMGIGIGFAVICLDSITNHEERRLVASTMEAGGLELVTITHSQMESFAGNVLALRGKDETQLLVLSRSALEVLTADQIARLERYCTLVPLAIQTIETIGGGSARCMIAELFLPLRLRKAN